MRAGLAGRPRAKSMRYRGKLTHLWVNIQGRWYESLPIWRTYCENEVTGGPIQSRYNIAEE
jgi:hypothetical protein